MLAPLLLLLIPRAHDGAGLSTGFVIKGSEDGGTAGTCRFALNPEICDVLLGLSDLL